MKLLHPYWSSPWKRTGILCMRCRRHFANVDAALLHAETVHPEGLIRGLQCLRCWRQVSDAVYEDGTWAA